ncbi:amino acid ABC transporter permease [Clostridium uliginosum]|uniref:Polar amino acid transport system permease protein n=1 Tax=Clostridium uliginosum TaxID=119641 RepID=A0A1I1H5E9_9CLOT|nr:amino acid ABC transporter permease [Clostridium uliginosum]SFC19184.1 polar amino acid transport system permease protein [Clostridium uliginosum]
MLNMDYKVLFQGNNLERILQGLLITARIALISVLIALIFGVIFGVIMTSKNKVIKAICRFYLEAIRIIPILVWLFILYFGVAKTFNLNLDGEIVSIIVFSFWGIAEMGDIVRGAITSIPKHQEEAGIALGLDNVKIFIYVLIPQAIKRIIPGAINLATRMIKTTSLVVLIGVVEVVKVGQQIVETSILKAPTASFWVYGFIFFLYFIICYPLSKLSKVLENKWIG